MSNSGKQSPLGINTLSGLIQDSGLTINPSAASYMGESTSVDNYTSGTIISQTLLDKITTVKNLAYQKIGTNVSTEINVAVYTNLIECGSGLIPGLANTDPTTFNLVNNATATTATNNFVTCTSTENFQVDNIIVFTGTAFGGITAGTIYYILSIENSTQFTISTSSGGSPLILSTSSGTLAINNFAFQRYGFIQKIALQAYNEFNVNQALPNYCDFLQSFLICYSYMQQINPTIATMVNSKQFMDGTYSNMNDLITSDISGVNLSLLSFGQDLINTGKSINLATINSFGMPSNLLQTLQTNNALTKSVSLACLMTGLDTSELGQILGNISTPTPEQERKIYDAFNIIVGDDLSDVLTPLNVNTPNIESLADLLDVKKLFPNSYPSLTVPVYNTLNAPANSKIYYPIFDQNGGVNSQLSPLPVNLVDCG